VISALVKEIDETVRAIRLVCSAEDRTQRLLLLRLAATLETQARLLGNAVLQPAPSPAPPAPTPLPKKILSTSEAASFLRVSSRTLEKWRTYGGGPQFSRLGTRVVYSAEHLEAFAAARSRHNTNA